MNIFLVLGIALVNIVAVSITYLFIKKMDTRKKIIIMAISIASMYIVTLITYWISGFGIDSTLHEASKDFIIYLFVPINMLLFIPYIIKQYIKVTTKQLKTEEFGKRILITLLLLLVVLVFEVFYFKNIQNNITKINGKNDIKTNDKQQVTITNNTLNKFTNEISNEILNETSNGITNNINNNEIRNVTNNNIILNDVLDNSITNSISNETKILNNI